MASKLPYRGAFLVEPGLQRPSHLAHSKYTMVGAPTSYERIGSRSRTAAPRLSSSTQTTLHKSLRSFGYHFRQLPPELRYLIYNCLVAERVIEVLGEKGHFLGAHWIENLLEFGGAFLHGDVTEWLKSRQDLISAPGVGRFDSSTAVFSATFAYVPYSKSEWSPHGRIPPMDWVTIKNAIAWDKFSSSQFYIDNVRRIRIDLYRRMIFTGRQPGLESFKTDLRSIANFRNLERIDIDCDTHMYTYEDLNSGQDYESELGVEFIWSTKRADVLLRRVWRCFWRYGGWCHPGRACTCCALPEIRVRGYGSGWQLLEFEPEVPESNEAINTVYGHGPSPLEVTLWDRQFGRNAASIREWVMFYVQTSKIKRLHEIVVSRSKRNCDARCRPRGVGM